MLLGPQHAPTNLLGETTKGERLFQVQTASGLFSWSNI